MVKQWSEKEKTFLEENYQNMSDKELSMTETLKNRTDYAIRKKRQVMGLLRPRKVWTENEMAFLEDNYKSMTDNELSVELKGRSSSAVFNKRMDMGLLRERPRKKGVGRRDTILNRIINAQVDAGFICMEGK